MLNLIKLEWKKHKFRGSWLGFIIVNAFMLFTFGVIYADPMSIAEEINFNSYAGAFAIIDTFVRIIFIVYASVLLAKFVIEEYKNKTMVLMFTYPISRKKLIAAKLMIVSVWTFLAIIVSNLILTGALVLANSFYGYIPGTLEMDVLIRHGLKVLFHAAASAGLSLIPLFFGMWKKSVPATIISAVLLVSIINSDTGGFTLSSIVAVPIVLAVIGVLIAYLSIYNIDRTDLN